MTKSKQLLNNIFQQFPSGNILYKDLFSSFPYRNTIDMVELSGVDLKSCLKGRDDLQVQGGMT